MVFDKYIKILRIYSFAFYISIDRETEYLDNVFK